MLKRLILFFIGFIVLASLAYYGFSRWQESREKINLWTLVPDEAAFVVETNNHTALVTHLKETELWDVISGLPFALKFEENYAWLDSISPGNQRLAKFFDKKKVLTSAHVMGKTELNFVFYVPVSSVGEHRFLRNLTENLNKSTIFKEKSDDYLGHLLTTITNTSTRDSFTFFTYHNNIIISSSPVLIEEIIRRIDRGNLKSVKAGFEKTNYLNQPDVYANVFINYRGLPDVLGLFLKDEIMPQVRYLASLCHNGMLELKLEPGKIFLNGFSNPEMLKSSFHTVMAPPKPIAFEIKNYIPLRTAVLLHFGLEEISKLQNEPGKEKATGSAYAVTVDKLAKAVEKELALAYLESLNISTSPEKVVFARLGKKDAGQNALNLLIKQISEARKKPAYSESYRSYQIRLIDVPELPAALFGKLFKGFDQSYVVQVDDYLLFTSEMATMRTMLDDIDGERVWSKSITQKSFLAETLQEANFGLFINTVNSWYLLNRYIEEEDRESLLQAARFIRRFNQISFQFAKEDSQYYTSFLLRKQEQSPASQEGSFTLEQEIDNDSRIVTQPFPVQNAIDKSWEVVFQDSAGILHNVTANGKKGWTDTLTTSIHGQVQQITIGSENKLRYAFTTSKRIHAINNQGVNVENFPFNVGDSIRLQRLTVLDYEKNGNYNLLTDDLLGNLYMYDVRGNAIPGWEPRRMDYRLAAAPQHIRVAGNDVIIVALMNGYIYALNKSGEALRGFPVNLRAPLTSDVFVNPGSVLSKTEITAVTRYGEVVVLNLQGRTISREQLLRPSKSAFFEMVLEKSGKSFVIVRQEQGRVAIFDQDLREQFEKRYVTSSPKIVQFFNFVGGKKIYTITETGPQETYLYNTTGNLIGGKALDSAQPVSIFYNETENNYAVYKVYRKQLQKLSFKLKE
jgi:hypothetical protein